MAAAAKNNKQTVLRLLEGGLWRFVLAALLLAIVAAGLGLAWNRWGDRVIDNGRQITADSIRCTPQPPWIRAPITEQALRDGSLDQLSIFDRQAAVQVARAFEMHPWVKRVVRVSKHPPASFQVELTYREPVAMVVVQTEVGSKLLPIDEEAIILPGEDFYDLSDEKIRGYPRISVSSSTPRGLVGTPWGDARVADAARIASLLSDQWSQWGLYQLYAVQEAVQAGVPPSTYYVLATRTGSEVIWGSPPDREASGEPPAAVKLQRLGAFVEQNGSLAKLPAERTLDLRQADLQPETPRTAGLRPVPR